ncbi:UbiE/COQ5 methyltransferase [Janibacter sp. HTCC2649]|uniref:class I SAM-dependent methyltransferase n=1 Tax=Janibacter sp. HTCC2649 TaxID=313589 RepID=UPI000066EC45|nr:class I SAM-dependent methyltransferase [Janibacter sp. HTCC2649]EAP99611.1 UbiE/COQ5 methyltransferase [Janibacter sp. HTCC2649]
MSVSSSPSRQIAARVGRRTATVARAAYYATGYRVRYPGKESLEGRLHQWETATGRGDVPLDQSRWDEQYGRGRWTFLSGIEEMAHYAVIVGYATFLKPHSSVLDVGCGAGVLHERFAAVGYERYTGVDLSRVAVDSLQDSTPPNAIFYAADAATFTPPGTYDVIVFNESITYFSDPMAVFAHYQQFLSPAGVVIVSCHIQSPRANAILLQLTRDHAVLDETIIRQGKVSWRCVAFGETPPA